VKDGIDWAEVGAGGRFEKIVSVLLSTLHPDSERIDGAGGDGGRDHQLRVDGELHLWQSKYFLRRLSESSTRKNQIMESLNVAAGLQPDSWTLVTPMVPNPTERGWLDNVAADYPFPVIWRGSDWIEARLAEHPSIVRHFMGPNDQYVQLIRELREHEEALVDGLPAARRRIEELAAKINESHPFFTFDFSVQNGQIANVSLRPKNRSFGKDYPMTVSFTMVSGSASAELEESLRSALDWGTAVELPSSYVRNVTVTGPPGLGGTHDTADIAIGSVPQEPVDVSMRMVIRSPDGQHLAALPARLFARRSALRGVTLEGRDTTGVVEARIRLDTRENRFTLSLNVEWSSQLMLPGAALPILRFLRHADSPNTLSFSIGDALTTNPVAFPEGLSVPEATLLLVEGLDRLQTVVGEPFPVPMEWTEEDQRQVRRAVQLLDGYRVPSGIESITMEVTDLQNVTDTFEQSLTSTVRVVPEEPYVAHVAGHDFDLGPYTIEIVGARLGSPSSVDGGYRLGVYPPTGSRIEIVLGATQPGCADE